MRVGDTIDFWRVEGFEPDHLLRLRAEMRLPGRAWLQLEVDPDEGGAGGSTITQTALFDPDGVAGLAYWYLIWPVPPPDLREHAARHRAARAHTPDGRPKSTGAVGRTPANRSRRVTCDSAAASQFAHVRGTG